ncbi:BTB/POZ domain-containing protein KCTD6 [Clupea harengus]|uniref:BTB/POZ domain-containing protein KCTD6 n=1 Tax=Clupea harengus TaxID=7950 RepID=A0A6P8F969_CLUHA|nr:BTB/POZ domain-containing protein KCTD6 [Clupea harengus]XP_031421799.1 BTB/POZ domain-containing protein KCTD6 [Clupea harengus]
MENGDWDYMMTKPVTLNVGGHLYTTTMSTLQRYPDSMLGAMFCGDLPTTRDSQGNYFIDRDGTLFHYILNFLRTSELTLPIDFMKTDLLHKEADFYQIEPLIQCLNNPKPPYPLDTFEQMTKPVTLNVGGQVYSTSMSTLQRYPDSMLGGMFRGDLPTTRDAEGNYFIDRDGTLFRYILNFLRASELILPINFTEMDLLRKEADFYQIEPLIQSLNDPKPLYSLDTYEQMTKPVTLNVGGHLYTTTLSTLQRYPDSMLGAMFRGDLPTTRDVQGNYFIDRDGTLFRFILNFLRTSELIRPVSFTEMDLLRKEADFYQVEPLIQCLNDPKPPYPLDTYEQTVELSSTRKLSKYSNPVAVIITQVTVTTKVHSLLEGISNNFTKWNKHMMDTRDCQVSFTFGPCDYHQEVALRVHLMDYITKQGFTIRNTRVHHMSERANENTVEHNWTFCRPAYKVED